MDLHIEDAKIVDYQHLIPALELPDPNDRHVLAAAIVGRCDVIVTQNIKHFPQKELELYGIDAQHPDDFLVGLLGLHQGRFCSAIKATRSNLTKPPYTAEEYLQILVRVGLVATAASLQEFADLL